MRALSGRRPPRSCRPAAGRAVGQPAGQRAGLPAAVVPVPQGAGRVGAQQRGQLRLRGARAGPARRRRSRSPGRAVRPPGVRSGTRSPSTPTGCPRSSGPRPSRRWSVSSPGRRRGPTWSCSAPRSPSAARSTLGGRRVPLTGTADRVEREPDGRVRIVDFKTGRRPPAPPTSPSRTSSGSTSWRCRRAFDAVAGPDARPSGAELVYLRLADGPGSRPRCSPRPRWTTCPSR